MKIETIKLSDAQKEIIKQHIGILQIRLDQWKIERKAAHDAQKSSATKYFQGIAKRIKYAEQQVSYYEAKISEFELVLLKGEI